MSKRQILSLIGVFVIIINYLGLPDNIDNILYIVTGLVIIIYALTSKNDSISKKEDKPFVEYHGNEANHHDKNITSQSNSSS